MKTNHAKPHLPSLALWGMIGSAIAVAIALALARRFLEAVLCAGAAHAAFCVSAAIPNHRATGPLVTRFQTRAREVWLTIDDGPHPDSTPAILDVLRRHKARATFFVIGRRAARWPELVRRIVGDGHSLGNHTFTHQSAVLWGAGPGRLGREIDQTAAAIIAAGVEAPGLFRPAVGMANLFLNGILQTRKMIRVGWSARGFDTRPQPVDAMIERITRQCHPGAIILFHEMGATAGPGNLDLLLTRLATENFRCVVPAWAAEEKEGRA